MVQHGEWMRDDTFQERRTFVSIREAQLTNLDLQAGTWNANEGRALSLLVCLMLVAISAVAQSHKRAATGSREQRIANLRAHIHHVFVIYQENRSFDSYFGTFPGADNLATPEARQHGFRQYDALGHTWITPFLLKASDIPDADHSRPALLYKSDHGRMDKYIEWEENKLVKVPHGGPEFAICISQYRDRNSPLMPLFPAMTSSLRSHAAQRLSENRGRRL